MARTPSARRYGLRFIEALEERRLLVAGALDTSFSGDGLATVSFPAGSLTILDTALQADGKVVVVGKKGSAGALARLNFDGSIDTSFGVSGLFEFGSAAGVSDLTGVAIQPDGKIVACGNEEPTFNENFTAVRINANGSSLDFAFGTGGIARVPLDGVFARANDMAMQKDGKILVAGTAANDGFLGFDYDFYVTRLNGDGTRDMPFGGGDGISENGFGEQEQARALTIDYNGTPATNPLYGTIVVVGQQALGDINSQPAHFAIERLTPTGNRDGSFDGDGKLIDDVDSGSNIEFATGVVVQSGGKIVICGTVQNSSTGTSNFTVVRYNSDGAVDTTFGSGGSTIGINFGGPARAEEIAVNYVGGLIVSGSSGGLVALAALTKNGVLDSRFDQDGLLKTTFGGTGAGLAISGNTIKPVRRIVVAGGSSVARLIDVGPSVTIVPFDTNVSEAGQNPGAFFVQRSDLLPFATTVFLGIGGTASTPRIFPLGSGDYFGTNISFIGTIGAEVFGPSVVIPANETVVFVTITPNNDTLAEGPETAVFTIASSSAYEIGTNPSTTLTIADDDGVLTNIGATDDSYVRDGGSANTTFGTAPELQVKTGPSGLNRLSYFKFNLSSFGVISSAKLSLFGRLSDAQNTNVLVNLFSVANTSWTGSTLTFNNKPPPGATPLASVTVTDSVLRRYEFDVSNYVKQEKALGHNLVSFMLQSPATTESFLIFNSLDAASNRPNLAVVTPTTVGIFEATPPPKNVRVGEDSEIAVTWTVPLEGWRQLSSIDLLLTDLQDEESSALLKFDEQTNSFAVVNGSGVLASGVSLVPEKSTFAASGPTSPTVTVTFVFRFDDAAAGHRFALDVFAENDMGLTSDFSQIGTIHVKKQHPAELE